MSRCPAVALNRRCFGFSMTASTAVHHLAFIVSDVGPLRASSLCSLSSHRLLRSQRPSCAKAVARARRFFSSCAFSSSAASSRSSKSLSEMAQLARSHSHGATGAGWDGTSAADLGTAPRFPSWRSRALQHRITPSSKDLHEIHRNLRADGPTQRRGSSPGLGLPSRRIYLVICTCNSYCLMSLPATVLCHPFSGKNL